MKNNKLKLVVAVIAVLPLLAWSNLAFAWEGTGTLCTGICPTTFDGTVIVPPTASPAAGPYTSAQSVILTTNDSLSIRYTTDGSTPTCSIGTVYSGAISVSSSQTITAISCYQDNHFSSVVPFAYIINISTTTNIPTTAGGGEGGNTTTTTTPTTTTTTTTPTTKIGDANRDNKIDKYDFALMMANWGKTGTNSCDFNNDGKVDKYDFALLMLNWNK